MIDNEIAEEVLHGYSEPIMFSIVNIDNVRSTLDDIDWIGAVGFDKIPPKVLKILTISFSTGYEFCQAIYKDFVLSSLPENV